MAVRLQLFRALLASLLLVLCAFAPDRAAYDNARPRRVLLLYQQQAETQPMVQFTQRLRTTVRDELGFPVEFYQEALDLDRFSTPEHSSSLARYFGGKYRGFQVDAIVPVGGRALEFAVHELHAVLPDTPIIFALCAAPQTDPSTLPSNVTGRIAPASRFGPTLTMARRLQPTADGVVVVGGAGRADSIAVTAAVSAVLDARISLPLTVLQGLSLDALLPRLRQLSRRSIVLFANYREDADGRVFEPLDIVGTIAHAAPAPMYTQLASYVGEGVVGGFVTRFDDEGTRIGRLITRVLRRRPGEAMPAVETVDNSFVADWRQLIRLGLSGDRLPQGTAVLFREPTFWQRYWSVVLLTLIVVGAQLLLIGRLLLERQARHRAQLRAAAETRRAEESRRQITHVGRVALVGELASTISHELRQPLAAIRTNAESGARLLSRSAAAMQAEDWQVVRDIFDDIVRDDLRAADIISRTRALLRREELPHSVVNLNDVCCAAARILEYDAFSRGARIDMSLERDVAEVMGDPVQLQQVVLNLGLNAIDACASVSHPRIAMTTEARGAVVEVVVRDNGPGLPPDVQSRLFESFFTTKKTGLGLGLVIVQSIVERHHGHIRAENGQDTGAVFRVVLPRMRRASTGIPVIMAQRSRAGAATSTRVPAA